MHPGLAAEASQQLGLFTRAQAIEHGYSDRNLKTMLRPAGDWVIVRPGVYVERPLWESWASAEQMVARDRAVHLRTRAAHVLSHDSAARLLGIPLLHPDGLAHVTRKGVGGSRTEHGIKHHLSQLRPPVDLIGGVPATAPARTAVDLAREHGLANGVIAADAVLRRGVPRRDMEAELLTMKHWPHVERARKAVELADPGAENPAESLGRLLVIELGLGVGLPVTQFPIRTVDGVKWSDIRVGRHLFEVDGRVKYLLEKSGGVAHDLEDVVWAEKNRERAVVAEDFGVSRLFFRDFFGHGRVQARERLRHEFHLSSNRFGTELRPHEIELFERLRAERHRRIFGHADRAA